MQLGRMKQRINLVDHCEVCGHVKVRVMQSKQMGGPGLGCWVTIQNKTDPELKRLCSYTAMEEDSSVGIGEKERKRKHCAEVLDILLGMPPHQRLKTSLLGTKLKRRYLEWACVV